MIFFKETLNPINYLAIILILTGISILFIK
jgi:multidrug transporter EmrE-like cation transporter